MSIFKDYTKKELEGYLSNFLRRAQAFASARPILCIVFSFCIGYICALLGKIFFAILLLSAVLGIAIYIALPDNADHENPTKESTNSEGN